MPLIFKSVFERTNVTAVKATQNHILAATGSRLYIFKKVDKKCVFRLKVFDGNPCFGIVFTDAFKRVLLFGANEMKIFECNLETLQIGELYYRTSKDWIITAAWIDNKQIIALTMHNVAILYNSELNEITTYICEEKCILYSGFIYGEAFENCIICSGTVFNEILTWKLSNNTKGLCPVLHRLKGHRGVIFSVHCLPNLGLICSTSDDRTAKLWRVESLFSNLNENNDITLLCTVFGHSARVFRCQILPGCFMTAGEDSIVNVWNYEGQLIRKIVANKGSSVWALDYDATDDTCIIGNEDGSVISVKLVQTLNHNVYEITYPEKLKQAAILASGNMVMITEDGCIFYFLLRENRLKLVEKHHQLKSYALLKISKCRKCVALASFHGNVYIYKERASFIHLKYAFETKNKTRIFSLHWLTCKILLTCQNEGSLKLWTLDKMAVKCVAAFLLPYSKERWSTVACLMQTGNIVVGDRKGNIHLFSIGTLLPIQTIKKAHSHLGVTDLVAEGNLLVSLGRNGILKTYILEPLKLVEKSSDKLPFTWLSKLDQYEQKQILGFSGKDFVVWDCEGRRCILQHPCGGGHRSWDFYKHSDSVIFVYLKNQSINVVSGNWQALFPVNLIDGFHSAEINAMVALNISEESGSCILVSGGEDTTFQISTINVFGDGLKDMFYSHEVLKSHLSSIRTVVVCAINEYVSESNRKEYLIFSGGGRAQIVLWLLRLTVHNDKVGNINCCEKCSYYENVGNEESEVRIMDMATIKTINTVSLFAACSDGKVKIFTVNVESEQKLILRTVLEHKSVCILKICTFVMCDQQVLITLSTDGKLTFWNISNITSNDLPSQSFYELVAHQSGINSYSYRILNNRCYFLTGGDDNAIVLHILDFTFFENAFKVTVVGKFVDISSHCAQITGVFLNDSYFITSSKDQKVLIYKWEFSDRIYVDFIGRYNSAVTDIQGLQVVRYRGSLYAVPYGNGIEVIRIVL